MLKLFEEKHLMKDKCFLPLMKNYIIILPKCNKNSAITIINIATSTKEVKRKKQGLQKEKIQIIIHLSFPRECFIIFNGGFLNVK